MAWQDLTWTSFRNTQAYPHPNDLRKISGVDLAWDADAVSSEQIVSAAVGAGVRFKLWPLTVVAAGLSHDNPNANYTSIDYCIMAWAGDTPTTQIYENGVLVWDSGGVTYLDQYLKIIINASGQVEYWAADTLLYTSTVVPSLPLFADASMYNINILARVFDAQIEVGIAAAVDHLLMMGV